VLVEVCLFTALLGLAMHALPGLQMKEGDVNAPGYPGVRDYMLKYMAQVFVGGALGTMAAQIAGWVVSIVIAGLLMSAVNTAIVDLIAIQFLMSRDRELPSGFQRLNRFGVPVSGMLVATLIPAVLVLVVSDMAGLADLYAIGVVGAIAANLGSTSTDTKLALRQWERGLMFVTFVIMAAIEVSLFVDKPHARIFAVTVLAIGLVLRGLASEHAAKKQRQEPGAATSEAGGSESRTGLMEPIMCAVRTAGKTLDFSLQEARALSAPLYVVFVREQAVVTEEDRRRTWTDDAEANAVLAYANAHAAGIKLHPCYAVSHSPADTIVDLAATFGTSRLILGAPERNTLLKLLRGNIVRRVSEILPASIRLLICA
jgi:nucleotide-binding universal stress UspA family protein/tetrahydromethanopterin S-methyltransferase subunit F